MSNEFAGWKLESKLRFDREQTKEFAIPIVVTDNGVEKMSATSTLTVVIGDGNDNAMSNGSSSILAYNFQNSLRDTRIGRVYVQDADDWDLPDKTFQFAGQESPYFQVTAFGGFITVNDQTPVTIILLYKILTIKFLFYVFFFLIIFFFL